jgi:ParB-like chromosome segregation protein Spo0J
MNEIYKIHDLCKLFPPMTDEEYEALMKSMKERGFDTAEPVILLDGMILDGRHRYSAALDTDTEPVFRDFNEEDPLAFVIRKNMHRRHLTTSQRSAIAAEICATYRADPPNGGTAKDAADAMNVSLRSTERAASVMQKSPHKFEEVKAGKKTVGAAEKEISDERKSRKSKSNALEQAIKIITGIVGEEETEALMAIPDREIIRMSGLDADEMKRVLPFLKSGWKLDAAMGHKSVSLVAAHTIRHLMGRAIESGGSYTLEIEDFIIEVRKRSRE